jgi:F-type H+-transporting ATPase subunit b
MLSIDYSVFIQIANFLILLLLLNFILFRPLRRVMSQRSREMDDLAHVAADLQTKAAEHSKTLEENLSSARKQGFKEKEGLRSEALNLEKRMYQEATASAGGKMEQARKTTEENVREIRISLENEIGLFSQELAEKILGRRLQ